MLHYTKSQAKTQKKGQILYNFLCLKFVTETQIMQ